MGEAQAIAQFEKKKRDKTQKGDYTEVEINYGDDEGGDAPDDD